MINVLAYLCSATTKDLKTMICMRLCPYILSTCACLDCAQDPKHYIGLLIPGMGDS